MKRLVVFLALTIFYTFTQNLSAQQWSKEQQEVWTTVQTYNQYGEKRDIKAYSDYFDDSYSGWEYDYDVPEGKEALVNSLDFWFKNVKVIYQTITPATIWVKGDFAYVHYYYTAVRENKDGKAEWVKGRWTDILMKNNGKWVIIGDHGGKTGN